MIIGLTILGTYAAIGLTVSLFAALVDRRHRWAWDDLLAYGLPGLMWPATCWIIWDAYRKQR